MKIEPVEIYSDKTNSAVMRHPGRKFPGVLVQGDNLNLLCTIADSVCANLESKIDSASYRELDHLRHSLQSYLGHYKATLIEHGIRLPFLDPLNRPPEAG